MNFNNTVKCGCDFNIKTVGVCDVSRLNINGSNRANLNWSEISIPEILCIPLVKPDIEAIDQVYANIILDNIKLIETPFAYREYVLFSFYTSINGLTAALPGLLTTLTGSVTGLITPALDTTLITAFNTLETALSALTAVPGVPALITLVNGFESDITNLISDLNTATTAVTTAVDNLLAAIATTPLSPESICAAIQALIDALNALTLLVNSIITLLTNMLNSLNDAATAIGNVAVTTAVTAATTVLTTLINTTLPPLITTVLDSITAILDILAPIDCTNSTVFVLINNEEGTCLSGRKLIVEGVLKQKIVYTAEVETQSVHSAHYEIPFISYIIPYAKFENAEYQQDISVYDPETNGSILVNGFIKTGTGDIVVDLDEEFSVDTCIEDIYVYALDNRRVFKNVTLFLKASPKPNGALCTQN